MIDIIQTIFKPNKEAINNRGIQKYKWEVILNKEIRRDEI